MNKLIIALVVVASSCMLQVQSISLAECKAKFEQAIAGVQVPKEFLDLSQELRQSQDTVGSKDAKLTELFNGNSGLFKPTEYMAKLSEADQKKMRQLAKDFLEVAFALSANLECDFDYSDISTQMDNFKGYVSLSMSLYPNWEELLPELEPEDDE